MKVSNGRSRAVAAVLSVAVLAGTVATASANTELGREYVAAEVGVDATLTTDAQLAATPVVVAGAAGAAVGAFAVGFAVGFVKCLLGRKAAELEAETTLAQADLQEALLD